VGVDVGKEGWVQWDIKYDAGTCMGCVVEYAAAQEKEKRGKICKRPSETKRQRGNEGGILFCRRMWMWVPVVGMRR
jgi:hypothetical protein